MSLTDELIALTWTVARESEVNRYIATGSFEVMKRAFSADLFTPDNKNATPALTYAGVRVIEDPRVPHGVWVQVPVGKNLSDATVVGFVAPEYAEAATAFANALNAARGFRLSPTI